MRKFDATIEGATPFLFNRFLETQEVIESIGKAPTDATKLDDWRKKEAMLRVYQNGEGPFLPSRNIRSTMVAGAKALQMKHKPASGRAVALYPFLRRGLIVEPLELVFGQGFPEIGDLGKIVSCLHRDVVRIPPGKGAMVIKYWPKFEDWKLSFTLTVFDDSLQEDAELKASLEAAGLYCGLGTGRPDYGKFTVTEWAEVMP